MPCSAAERHGHIYENTSFDDLAIVAFDLEGIEYIQRYDSAGDFFTERKISPDNVRVVKLVEKSNIQNSVSLKSMVKIFRIKWHIRCYRIISKCKS